MERKLTHRPLQGPAGIPIRELPVVRFDQHHMSLFDPLGARGEQVLLEAFDVDLDDEKLSDRAYGRQESG